MCQVDIKPSNRGEKKLMAVFTNCKSGEKKVTHFGAKGMSDFTMHHDEARKQRYITRHGGGTGRENWKDPYSAGALSRYILWNKHTRKESIDDYKKRFGFK
jgi:hypothetical protein